MTALAPTTQPILRLIGLHKRFGGLVATNYVSLSLARHLQDQRAR